jgi:hypothetical protein
VHQFLVGHYAKGFAYSLLAMPCCLIAIASCYKLYILAQQKLYNTMAISMMCIFNGQQGFFTNYRWWQFFYKLYNKFK